MKNKLLFILALVANVAPLGLCFFYRGGAMLLYPVFAVIHILLFLLNQVATKSKFQLALLGLIHIVVTFCVHQQVGWLYLHYVFDDAEGRAIISLGTMVGVIWTSFLCILSLKSPHRKHGSKADE